MPQINIDTIARLHGMTLESMANVLFPEAKYKRLALDRIRNNEAVLSITQAVNLAEHLGVRVDDLLMNDNWTGSRVEGLLTIVRDGYRVVLHNDSHLVRVYHDDYLIDELVIDTSLTKLSSFITTINTIITNFENDGLNS